MRRALLALFTLVGLANAANIAPANPNTTAEARKLLAYLQNLGGQGILSGQLSMLNDTFQSASATTFRERFVMTKNGGKLPALYASNFGDWPMDYQQAIVTTIKEKWVKSGGKMVVMLCWHTVQPDTTETLGYSAMSRFSNTDPYPRWKIDSILKPGTALNIEHMKRLKVAAGYLKSLDSAGIPVLWRPYHENNGSFFWWGQQPRFKELWAQMYDYYVDSLKLNNLLWVYSTCWFGEGDSWVDSLYPGHKYVDVLGADIYAGSYGQDYQSWIYGKLLSKGEGRPIGITENGRMPHVPSFKYTQPKWTFFCTWWGYEVDTLWKNAYYHPDGYTIQNPDSLYASVYGDPYTITQDEVDFDIAPDSHVFLSGGESPKGSGYITASPDSTGRYQAGQTVTLTAVPTEGWVFTGWAGDASGSTNPLVVAMTGDKAVTARFSPLRGTNLLLNGKFSQGMNDWSFSAWQTNAKATASVTGTDSVFAVDVTGTSADPWGIQLTQGLLLDSGVTYQVSFDASGTERAVVSYAIGESSGDYRKIWSGADTIGTATRTTCDTIVDTLPSATALRLEFNLGKQTGSLKLDNIKVARISGTDPSRVPSRATTAPEWSLRAVRGGFSWKSPNPVPAGSVLRLVALDGSRIGEFPLVTGSRSGRIALNVHNGALLARIPGGETILLPMP